MTFRIRLHPSVADDLTAIMDLIAAYAGPAAALRRLAEVEETLATLALTPHKGTLRDEIAPGLRAIPAGRKAVIAFTVDDAQGEVLVHAIGFAGSDWMSRSTERR